MGSPLETEPLEEQDHTPRDASDQHASSSPTLQKLIRQEGFVVPLQSALENIWMVICDAAKHVAMPSILLIAMKIVELVVKKLEMDAASAFDPLDKLQLIASTSPLMKVTLLDVVHLFERIGLYNLLVYILWLGIRGAWKRHGRSLKH